MTGTLIGMAIEDGALTLQSTIGDLIPNLIPANADPLTQTITVENLLTMTAGWAWDIHADYPTLIGAENWTNLTLGLPVAYQPGTFFAYNTGSSHLLSVILNAATGMDTIKYADSRLFNPIGIDRPHWQRSPQGDICGGFGLEVTCRDLARFGLLGLRSGQWNGKQLVLGRLDCGGHVSPIDRRFDRICCLWVPVVGDPGKSVSGVFRARIWQQLPLYCPGTRPDRRRAQGLRDSAEPGHDRASPHRGLFSAGGYRARLGPDLAYQAVQPPST